MNPAINPALIEDIQKVIEGFAVGKTFEIFGAQDETSNYKNIFAKDFDVSFNDIRNLYYYIELPHDLHVTLEDAWMDIDFPDFSPVIHEDPLRDTHSSKKSSCSQTINLYICESPPQIKSGLLELGMRILHISWSKLFREVPYGIQNIHLSVRYATLENSERLLLLLKVIEEVSKVKCLKDHT